MTASTVWINGVPLGEYKGGFTPFSFDLTDLIRMPRTFSLSRSTPPSALTFRPSVMRSTTSPSAASIAKSLCASFPTYIDNIFARPRTCSLRLLGLDVDVFSPEPPQGASSLEVELRDGDRVVAQASQSAAVLTANRSKRIARPQDIAPVHASTETTTTPRVTPSPSPTSKASSFGSSISPISIPCTSGYCGRCAIDADSRRIGFREATFTDHGFSLNGKILKLRGLDRHQTFPFVGQAMPARVQRKDADILRTGSTATSSEPLIIRSPVTSLIAAMRSVCLSSRSFRAGSTLAPSPGSRSLSTM